MKKEYNLKINGVDYNVVIDQTEDASVGVEVNGTPFLVEIDRLAKPMAKVNPPVAAPVNAVGAPVVVKQPTSGSATAIKSPLPGVVLSVEVNVGDAVKAGQKLLVLEAMKMENSIEADRDGKITAIKVAKGDSVLEGAELIIIG
ncbi:MAG: biotin/lipoyl-binding protein [Prevotellaceae bacterium]|jgi:biotin carboxyl carrier protein|nr:biotin/lipoyl-binding protein [Prevotellaceae bacterium]